MKSTGIVRKIDELGRIVIPKEIRRNLNIKDGEEIEICIENDCIILKKYFRLLSLYDVAKLYLQRLEKYINAIVLVTDRERIILASKDNYKQYVGHNISKTLLECIDNRKQITGTKDLLITKNDKINKYFIVYPIVVNTDSLGSVVCISENEFEEKQTILFEVFISLLKSHLSM